MAFHIVILCGGSGTRLWPLSRAQLPKQFAPLFGGRSLYQRTLERASLLAPASMVVVVAENQMHHVRPICPSDLPLTLKPEPFQRNTLSAVIYGSAGLAEDDVVLMMPSDHLIDQLEAFGQTVQEARQLAQRDFLVTLGITPTEPATGFGYIERGGPIQPSGFQVRRFVEKPAAARAVDMIAHGGFYWNSGMYLFKCGVLRQEVARYQPQLLPLFNVSETMERAYYEGLSSLSFDKGIAEKTERLAVVPADFGWDDMGSWRSVWQELEQGPSQIATTEGMTSLAQDCQRVLLMSDRPKDKIYAVAGLRDLAVVDTTDALLVTHLDQGQSVRELCEAAGKQRPSVTQRPTCEHRPWGSFEILQEVAGYKVKLLRVEGHRRLSLQSHQHRHEHWVVVKGRAKVICDHMTRTLKTGESIDIPLGCRHRLANPDADPLEVIEVQTGSYLGEDDIERFEDDFNRIP